MTIDGINVRNNVVESGAGGGIASGSSFTLSSCNVYSNTATNGGGMYLSNASGTVTMSGGKIYSNTVTTNGGGVYLQNGSHTLSMTGTAEISGNTATNSGGGVFVSSDATLSISSSAYIKNNTCSVSTSAGGVTWLGTVSGTKTHICGNTSFDYTDKSTSTKVTQACP